MSAPVKFAGGRNIAMKVPSVGGDGPVLPDVAGLKVIEKAPTVPPSVWSSAPTSSGSTASMPSAKPKSGWS
jgi:hypothetical protein